MKSTLRIWTSANLKEGRVLGEVSVKHYCFWIIMKMLNEVKSMFKLLSNFYIKTILLKTNYNVTKVCIPRRIVTKIVKFATNFSLRYNF